jgi:hypothetical protein
MRFRLRPLRRGRSMPVATTETRMSLQAFVEGRAGR